MLIFSAFVSCHIESADSEDLTALEIQTSPGEKILYVNFNRSASEKIPAQEMNLLVSADGLCSDHNDPCSRNTLPYSEPDSSSEFNSFICGSTKKKIYADEFSTFTLQAKKESDNTACLVWSSGEPSVPDNFFQSTVNLAHKIYEEETLDFGKEKELTNCDTFNALNIVLYDITENSVAGFYSKNDLLPKSEDPRSNYGKYIYLDNILCTDEKIASSTLAHEIMHMKTHSNFIQTESWFSELLSMIAEDYYADGPSSKNRLDDFYRNHYLLGIDQWRNLDPHSYSKTYAFGLWISNFFGGKKFIQEIYKTGKNTGLSNMDAILFAAEKITGKKYSSQEIFKLFIKNCADKIKTEYKYTLNNLQTAQLQSHGFMIHYAGTAEKEKAVLYFKKKKNPNEEIIIYSGDRTYVF